jgi:outer membrane biosynthesis protein TonB
MRTNKRYLILSWIVATLVVAPLTACAGTESSVRKSVQAPTASTRAAPLPAELVGEIEARANNKDAASELCLGKMYLNGYGVEENENKANSLLSNALDHGQLEANVYLAELYHEKVDHKDNRALDFLGNYYTGVMSLANQSDPVAETYFGYAYLYGLGILNISPDIPRALKWFNKAAAQGDGAAQAELALIYAHGWGVKVNPTLARMWRQKAGSHTVVCPADAYDLAEDIINSNMIYPDTVHSGKEYGSVVVRLPASGGVVSKPILATSSGHADIDKAVRRAATGIEFPVWKTAKSDVTYDVTIGLNQTAADINAYIGMIRYGKAIGRALGKRVYDLWSTNPYHSVDHARAWVSFHCKDGKVADLKLARSSGDALVDEINKKAVSTMSCPKAPEEKNIDTGDFPYEVVMVDPWDNPYFSPPQDLPHTGYATALRKAIEDSGKLPQHVLVFGTPGTGVTAVAFDIRNGKVSHLVVTQSSGDKAVDKEGSGVRSCIDTSRSAEKGRYHISNIQKGMSGVRSA